MITYKNSFACFLSPENIPPTAVFFVHVAEKQRSSTRPQINKESTNEARLLSVGNFVLQGIRIPHFISSRAWFSSLQIQRMYFAVPSVRNFCVVSSAEPVIEEKEKHKHELHTCKEDSQFTARLSRRKVFSQLRATNLSSFPPNQVSPISAQYSSVQSRNQSETLVK